MTHTTHDKPHPAPAYVPDDPLLTAREAAAERRQAISTFWRDVKAGRVPTAIYVAPKLPRWRRSEIRTALEACRKPGPDSTPLVRASVPKHVP